MNSSALIPLDWSASWAATGSTPVVARNTTATATRKCRKIFVLINPPLQFSMRQLEETNQCLTATLDVRHGFGLIRLYFGVIWVVLLHVGLHLRDLAGIADEAPVISGVPEDRIQVVKRLR